MRVAVFGLGYVGTVTAACLVKAGHEVVGIDPDAVKLGLIAGGTSPVVEPGLAELVADAVAGGSLTVADGATGAEGSEVVVVCVGTPSRSDGTIDLGFVERVTAEIGAQLDATGDEPVVVFRSTMPPGTLESVLVPVLETTCARGGRPPVAACPEFLREGSGVADFFAPPFTVVGTRDERAASALRELLGFLDSPFHVVEPAAAEALKYACNAFHALKVTFTNEMSRLLASTGVDARSVMRVFVEDHQLNLSAAYLRPGFAFGGSCLPKDLRVLNHLARVNDVSTPVLRAVLPSNEHHLREVQRRILDRGARSVALLGLSFKAETDDLRESPYVALAEHLLGKGVDVRIYDPIVNPDCLFGANLRSVEAHLPHLQRMLVADPAVAIAGADLVVVGTRDEEALAALRADPPTSVLDVSGRLPEWVETLPGYEGVAWTTRRS